MGRLIIDTSGYLAGIAAKHPLSEVIQDILRTVNEPPVVSPLVLAEIDYMVLDRVGVDQELAVTDDLTSGAYEIADLDVDDLRIARGLASQHRDLKVGITDALNAVLADRYDTNEILTTDQRHFRAVPRSAGASMPSACCRPIDSSSCAERLSPAKLPASAARSR